MTAGRRHQLDSRAWLAWGAAASLPLLTGRHPIVLVELLVIVLVVRTVCLPLDRARGWGWLLRIAAIAIPVGIIFNMFTVHAGETELFRIPDSMPILGGTVTWNAAVYGLLSGVTIVVLVWVGITVAAALDWSALMRVIPARASGIAVAGSVAWAFLPQLATSWREIREAQAARGHRWRGARDIVPLVVPLMAGGLERSVVMAEALETRGFGATTTQEPGRRWSAVASGAALTLAVIALYCFAVGRALEAGAALVAMMVCVAFSLRTGGDRTRRRATRYRETPWSAADSIVVASAVLVAGASSLALRIEPASLQYDPYPSLEWPQTSIWLLLALALLLTPAVVAPAPAERYAEGS